MDAILAVLTALKENAEQQQAAAAPAAPAAPASPAPAPAPAPQAVQRVAPEHNVPSRERPARAAHPLQGMFEDGNSLLQAIIAAEVLGPPAALREHSHWKQQPNEPST
jgi:hypothetical protein